MQFDDDRSAAALGVLADVASRTQVVLFTHHRHVRICAEALAAPAGVLAGEQAAVIDLDPQGSATVWGRLRGGVPPVVIAAHPPRLARVIEAAADVGASLVVIDTAPREAGGAAEAARLADLVMIPCRPSAIDLAATLATLAAIGMADAVAVLNGCPPRGPWVAEAVEVVRGFGLGRAPVTLGARIAHARAFTLGRTAQETEPAWPTCGGSSTARRGGRPGDRPRWQRPGLYGGPIHPLRRKGTR